VPRGAAAAPRPPDAGVKRYDRAYFDRWYRDPQTRIHLKGQIERKVTFAVIATEYLMQRPVERVLDVCCGEAPWQPILQRLRPGIGYAGVDSSEYAVARYGRKRNIRLGTFGRLREVGAEGPFDLIVCSDALHYVPTRELRPGLETIAELLGGVAFLETFTSADSIVGDMHDIKWRSPAVYERLFRAVGLVHCGLYCFVRGEFGPGLTAFERGRETGK
jgi:SAM-dependent methyltransferase